MLLDQYGRAIKSNKPILDEVAIQTIRDRYASYPSQGLTPERLSSIFREADQGDVTRQAELFEEMEEKDLHLGGILQTRKLAVSGLDWEVQPASDSAEDEAIAASAKEMIEYIENFEDVILDMMDAVGKGFAVQEIMWEMSEGKVWAKELKWVHQRRFTFNTPTILLEYPRLLTDDNPVWGEELLPNKFVVHKYRARSGATARGGLLRPCSFMYLFKNYDIKDWVVFNELFSVPMRVGKYKPGAGAEEKEDLKRAVFNLGVDAAAVISDNTIIELLESKLRGDAGTFTDLAEFCDKAMSKGVLGHTGSAEGTPGKLGGEDQAKQVRQDLVESDAKASMRTVKFQLLKPWVGYNFGPEKGVPTWKLHFEAEEDQEKTARVYGILVKDANFEGIPESHVNERFGIPMPKAGEKTLRAAQSGGPLPGAGNANGKGLVPVQNKLDLMVNAGADDGRDWVSIYMDRLNPILLPANAAAVSRIEEWLKSESFPPPIDDFMTKIESILDISMPAVSNPALQASVAVTVGEIYHAYRAAPATLFTFGGPDLRAIEFLSKLDSFYVSSFIKNSDAEAAVRQFLKERYLEQGAGLFGRGTPKEIQDFKDLMAQKLVDLGSWQIERIADTSVQRIRSWATVAQYHEAGITRMQVYEPTMECAFCVSMNGKVISVATAYETLMRQSAMTAEEYEADLRSVPPTLAHLGEVVEKGLLPPYHPHCHGMVLRSVK